MKLMIPPAAITESSAAIVWDKTGESCRVYLGDECVGETVHGDYTFCGLKSDAAYTARVESAQKCAKVAFRTLPEKSAVSICEFGADGDGAMLNTACIQRAIDNCPKGGKVCVPQGVFVTGALFLKSDMTLYLEKGAVLLGSTDTNDYPVFTYRWEGMERPCYASLINTGNLHGEPLENIAIEGEGVIDASGVALFHRELEENKGFRGRAVCLRHVSNLYLRGVTVKQSPAWCVHLIYCQNVTVNGVRVYTKQDEQGKRYEHVFNGDGLDPDSCRDVFVFASKIASQDDCIAIKSGRDAEGRRVGIPAENLRITNCDFLSGFGVAVGSEMSGSVRNVYVGDCRFQNAYSVGSVKCPRGRGGIIEHVLYEDCEFKNESLEHSDCRWFRGAIYVDHFYGHDALDVDAKQPVTDATPAIRDVTFRNISIDTVAGNAIFLCGLPERPLESITLENVRAVGKYGMKAFHVSGLAMRNVTVSSREDEPYVFQNVLEVE